MKIRVVSFHKNLANPRADAINFSNLGDGLKTRRYKTAAIGS